jgi:hypothetical protein
MTTETFREFQSPDVPDAVLVQAAQLFSDHYGIWDTPAGRPGGKHGTVSFAQQEKRHLTGCSRPGREAN